MPDQNAARNTPTRRCVWLDEETRDWMEKLPSIDYPRLQELVDAYDSAPADAAGPHGVVRVAITNAYYDARNDGLTMETAADNARDAVLRALGGFPLETT